ncbi:hypothetical protein MFM001_18630 [Mycobacterium sp. MFM001]|nr:hypothetical protein MFM001_18630 [Mycobacterium sp. MFM001]
MVSIVTVTKPLSNSNFAVATCTPVGDIKCVVRLSGATGPPLGGVLAGAGDPVQTDGVVPGDVAGGWLGEQALSSATGAASIPRAVAATTFRLTGLTMA